MTRHKHFPRESGSALISTLLMIVVLTIIVTAFMQSMAVERRTANSYKNKLQAELAAEAGANHAQSVLVKTNLTHLVNAYVEQSSSFNGSAVTAPYLSVNQLDTAGSSLTGLPRLMVSFPEGASALNDPAVVAGGLIDINTPSKGLSDGFIGLQDVSGARRVIPVPWVEVLKDPTKPKNLDRQDSAYNPIVARYAYWVDDESAKVNLWNSGSAAADGSHSRRSGRTQSEVAIHEIVESAPITGSLVAAFLTDRAAVSTAIGSPSRETLKQLAGSTQLASNWDGMRAFVTTIAKSDERGPLNIRKININDYVATATNFTTSAGRQQIVDNVVNLGDFINTALPEFGNRTHAGTVSPDNRRRYCIQIAANIYDYIDADSQPTVIRQNLSSWENPPDPEGIGDGAPTQPPAVFGKEVVPSVVEYLAHYYNSNGNLRIDSSFELLNIYTKPVNMAGLGPAFLLMAERNDITPLGAGVDPDLPGEPGNPPFRINLPSNLNIAAGRYHVVTTAPASQGLWFNPGADRTTVTSNEGLYPYGPSGLRMEGDQLATAADVLTEIVVANNYGYLDIQPRIAQQGSRNFIASQESRIATQPFGNAGSSAGNNVHRKTPLDTGDPRSLTEIFPSYSESGGSPSAIAWRRNTSNAQGATNLGGDSNFGSTSSGFNPGNSASPPSYLVEPLLVTGASALDRAVAVIRDGPMATIAELGLIYDPAVETSGFYGSTRERGGFRTLAIGTSRGDRTGPKALFPPPSPVPEGKRAYRLLDVFETQKDLRSKILLNSSLRDPRNFALRALFYGLKTQANSGVTEDFAGPRDPLLGSGGTEVNAESIVRAISTRAKQNGPFLSTGQLSDVDAFNTGSEVGFALTPNDKNSDLLDRGREEILRNTFELLTLKGSVYSIYVIAQAGEPVGGDFVPKSTTRLIRLLEMDRVYPSSNPIQQRAMPALLNENRPSGVSATVLGDSWQ